MLFRSAKFEREVSAFATFIAREKFREKRNADISHKALPEEWSQHRLLTIPYRTLRQGVGHALRLMKQIDRAVLGPAVPCLWHEVRKKRYELLAPAKVKYLLLPHMNLAPDIRLRVILEEMAEGRPVWSDMVTTINGHNATVPVCREWGALLLGGRMITLDQYPLVELNNITVPVAELLATDVLPEPVIEERSITTKYRVAAAAESTLSFAPVRRVHRWDDGALTELVDITIKLTHKMRQDFGTLNVGDEKEFTLGLKVITGYRKQNPIAS